MESLRMLTDYVCQRAAQMGVGLSRVFLTDGKSVGCLDSCLLELRFNRFTVATLLYKSELVNHKKGFGGKLFELKIEAALMKLKMLQEI